MANSCNTCDWGGILAPKPRAGNILSLGNKQGDGKAQVMTCNDDRESAGLILKGCRFDFQHERQNFLLQGQLSVLTLLLVSIPPLCYCSSTQKTLVLPPKVLNTDIPNICGFEHSGTVNWCTIVWCTQNMHQDSIGFMWHQPHNNLTEL